MPNEIKSYPFEIKAVDDSTGEFSGYAAVFGNIDSYGDIILPGAFQEGLDWFLANGAICWQHEWDDPIGKPLEAREDALGLWVKGSIVDTATGLDARKLLKAGIVRKLSIGFKVLESEPITGDNLSSFLGAAAEPSEIADAVMMGRALKKVKLYEVSPVTIPANDSALIMNVKGGPLAGLTFIDHSESVLAAVQGYIQRARALKDLRVKEGRTLSAENHARLTSIHEGVHACMGDLEDLLTTCKPQKSLDLSGLMQLRADLLKHEVDLNTLLLGGS